MQINRSSLFALLTLAGCAAEPTTEKLLPSASFTPHLESTSSSVACGEDVAFYGAATPDLTYAFSYDADSRLTHAQGLWTDGTIDTIDYAYDGDNFAHMLAVNGWDNSQTEITASYDAGNLVEYTWAATGPSYNDAWTYAYSDFIGPWQPTHETVTQAGQPALGYSLVYDANDRLVEAVPDSGPSTTWTYDDAAHTITTSGEGYVGVYAYDADFRPLSETWTGGLDTELTYDWNGDQLLSTTYRSGSENAPHTLETVQTSTLKYACAMARAAAGHKIRVLRPSKR